MILNNQGTFRYLTSGVALVLVFLITGVPFLMMLGAPLCIPLTECPVVARLGSVLHRSNPAGIGEHADIASVVEECRSYKLTDDEASVPVPAGAVNVEASGTEGETALVVMAILEAITFAISRT